MRRIERAEARAAAAARRAAVVEADTSALDAQQQQAQHLCDRCGGVGRCMVRGPCGHRGVRRAAIISCPDCNGKGVKPTLDQQVRKAAATVWRKSNPDDPVPDWLLSYDTQH